MIRCQAAERDLGVRMARVEDMNAMMMLRETEAKGRVRLLEPPRPRPGVTLQMVSHVGHVGYCYRAECRERAAFARCSFEHIRSTQYTISERMQRISALLSTKMILPCTCFMYSIVCLKCIGI